MTNNIGGFMDIVIFFSKYLILLFIGLFVFSSIVTILQENEKININLKNPSMLLLILFHGLTSCILIIGKDFSINKGAIVFCVLAFLFILLFKVVIHFLYRDADFLLIDTMLFMLDIGFVFLYRLDGGLAKKQLMFATGAVIVSIFIPFIFKLYNKCYERFKNFEYIFIAFIFGLLLLPTFFGTAQHGAKNWAYFEFLGGFSFQPSEIVKLIFVLYLGTSFSRAKNIVGLVVPTVVSFFSILILVSQNDFGGSLVFFTIYLVLLYVTTSSEVLLGLGILSLSFVSILAYKFVYHVRVRVDIFLDPFKSPYDQGLQILQSLFAIGTKAPFGSGLTSGYPKFIPVVESDFIFAGISEEFGAIFGLFLIILIFVFFMRTIKIGKEANQKNLILISLGISLCLVFQSFLIIAGNIKFVPLTGVTLPFISYGGTSVFMCITMIMILLRIDLINMNNDEIFNPFKLLRKNVNRVFAVILILYVGMFGYLFKFVFYQSPLLVSSTYNPRVSIVTNENVRGNIYDRKDNVLAKSTLNSDGSVSRSYPYGRNFAHTVGSIYSGKTGLELSYHFRMQDPKDELLQMMKALLFEGEKYGDSIKTTLDADLQQLAYSLLKGKKGAIIVSNAKTGEIISMVSYNDFNPDTYGAKFEELTKDEENTPLINRATQGLYPPASTFKILSSLNIIENMENYKNYTFLCTGQVTIDGETISCNNGEVHGEVNLEKAFAKSCNSFFATALESMEVDDLGKITEKFMFNKNIVFDLPVSKSVFTLDNSSKTGEIMQSAIGQGNTLATPLELNMIGQAVANGGVMKNPYMVSEILNQSGKTVQKFKDKDLAIVMTKEESEIITKLMKGVVEEGTAKSAKPYNTTLAGKTGTAEVTGQKSHGLFVGFAPAEDPEIVVTVVLENSGGSKATLPIVKQLVEYYFDHK